MQLRDYAPLDVSGRLQLLLCSSDASTLEDDRRRLRAVLSRFPEPRWGAELALTISREASDRLSWCTHLFKEEAVQLLVRPSNDLMPILLSLITSGRISQVANLAVMIVDTWAEQSTEGLCCFMAGLSEPHSSRRSSPCLPLCLPSNRQLASAGRHCEERQASAPRAANSGSRPR